MTVLTVIGPLDAATFPQLVREVDQALAAGRTHLVLDLAGVDYISSDGLVTLQIIARRATAQDGEAVLCGVQPAVMKVLDLTGFAQSLAVFPDQAAARASFEGSTQLRGVHAPRSATEVAPMGPWTERPSTGTLQPTA